MPAWSNFRAVLDAADAELFMWSAADDLAPPEYGRARVCAARRPARPRRAIPEVRFVDDAGRMRPAQGGFELLGTSRENARDFLAAPIDNSRFYGVFRRDALARAMPTEDFYGVDLAVSLATLRDGGQALLPGVVLVRGGQPGHEVSRPRRSLLRREPVALRGVRPVRVARRARAAAAAVACGTRASSAPRPHGRTWPTPGCATRPTAASPTHWRACRAGTAARRRPAQDMTPSLSSGGNRHGAVGDRRRAQLPRHRVAGWRPCRPHRGDRR